MKSLKDAAAIIALSIISYALLVNVILPGSKENVKYEDEKFFTNLYETHSTSVVSVNTTTSMGSGVFITTDLVLTNYHIVEDAPSFSVSVKIDDEMILGTTVLGKVVFTDPSNDIALIRIDQPIGKPAKMGDSLRTNIGDRVFSIGSPNGLFNSMGVGYITGKHRVLPLAPYVNIIQISTGVIGGQSGGALFNSDGELIGITYAALSENDNFGFAIPINTIKVALKGYIDLTDKK